MNKKKKKNDRFDRLIGQRYRDCRINFSYGNLYIYTHTYNEVSRIGTFEGVNRDEFELIRP